MIATVGTHASTAMLLFVLICVLFKISGAQDVLTISKVSVQEGKSIMIPCWYNHIYVNDVKYLSAGDYWALSNYVEFSDGRKKHKTVSVSDNKATNILTIGLRNILQSQSGTYWCAVGSPGSHARNSFHLKVTAAIAGLYVEDQMLTGFEGGSVTISCHYHLPRKTGVKWCKLGGKCVEKAHGILDGASVEIRHGAGLVTVSMSRLKMNNTGWYWCSVRELHMPVHITVSTRRETTTSLQTTWNQPTSSHSVKSIGTFSTSAQTPHSSDRRSSSWLIMLLIVVLTCCAATVIMLCKIKRVLPGKNSLEKLRPSDAERTHIERCERHLAQAASRDNEVIYSVLSLRNIKQVNTLLLSQTTLQSIDLKQTPY